MNSRPPNLVTQSSKPKRATALMFPTKLSDMPLASCLHLPRVWFSIQSLWSIPTGMASGHQKHRWGLVAHTCNNKAEAGEWQV